MNVTFEKVERFPKWHCPHCGRHPEDKFVVLDRNTCTLEVESDDFAKRSDFLFWELHCPCCGEISYLFELTIRPEVGDVQFIADGCWTVESRTKFKASNGSLEWEHERLEGVRFYEGEKAEWLGVHRFGPFANFSIGLRQVYQAIDDIRRMEEIRHTA